MGDSQGTSLVDRIESAVKTLSTASKNGLRAFHEAIINLDHVILSDLITPADAEVILAQYERDWGLESSQALYSTYETLLEKAFVEAILRSSGDELLGEGNLTQNYLNRYYNLVKNEVALAGITSDDKVLFIGSGPLPITAIEMVRQSGCEVDCIEKLPEMADISRAVIHHLGMTAKIRVYTTLGEKFPTDQYSVVLVGALAQPKQDIIDNIEGGSRSDVRLLTRTTEGLREFIYKSAAFETSEFSLSAEHHATRDQALSTLLWEKELVDVSALIPEHTGSPVKVKNDGESYVSNFDDPENHWLKYAFEAFQKLKDRIGPDNIKHFVSIASGPGIDAIGAIEILNPERVTITDLAPHAIESAKGNIARYKKWNVSTPPVEYKVGDLCQPLGDGDADIIYANLPNIPFHTEDMAELMEGINAASFFIPNPQAEIPNNLKAFLLAHQYEFLSQARRCLTPQSGIAVINLGIRFSMDVVGELFDSIGYKHEVLAFGLKRQTEARECLPGYVRHESSDDGVEFDYYPSIDAQKLTESHPVTSVDELKALLEPIKISARKALDLAKSGMEICHVVATIGAKPLN